MAKYRGVLLVPTVIEFESSGSVTHVQEQARRIARGMGKCHSNIHKAHVFEPTLMEISVTEGGPAPEGLNVVFIPE